MAGAGNDALATASADDYPAINLVPNILSSIQKQTRWYYEYFKVYKVCEHLLDDHEKRAWFSLVPSLKTTKTTDRIHSHACGKVRPNSEFNWAHLQAARIMFPGELQDSSFEAKLKALYPNSKLQMDWPNNRHDANANKYKPPQRRPVGSERGAAPINSGQAISLKRKRQQTLPTRTSTDGASERQAGAPGLPPQVRPRHGLNLGTRGSNALYNSSFENTATTGNAVSTPAMAPSNRQEQLSTRESFTSLRTVDDTRRQASESNKIENESLRKMVLATDNRCNELIKALESTQDLLSAVETRQTETERENQKLMDRVAEMETDAKREKTVRETQIAEIRTQMEVLDQAILRVMG